LITLNTHSLHDALPISHERNENQAYREQLELVRQGRDQLQEQLSQTQVEKQSLQTQLEEGRHTYTLLEERLQRHAAELSHERNEDRKSTRLNSSHQIIS